MPFQFADCEKFVPNPRAPRRAARTTALGVGRQLIRSEMCMTAHYLRAHPAAHVLQCEQGRTRLHAPARPRAPSGSLRAFTGT